MKQDALPVAQTIARAILPAERSIDTSMIEQAELVISILRGGQTLGVSGSLVHPAVMSASRAFTALSTARDETLRAHEALASVRDQLGLDPVATGCTPFSIPEEERRNNGLLRAVA